MSADVEGLLVSRESAADFVIVGGGVIGLTLAWELIQTGGSVTLLDRAALGTEASWAGAGMIPPGDLGKAAHLPDREGEAPAEPQGGADLPGDLADNAAHALAAYSAGLWEEFSATLFSETGIDNGYRRCGGFAVGTEVELAHWARHWRARDVEFVRMDPREVTAQTPLLRPEQAGALYFPTFAQVRNPRQLRALQAGCRQRGVNLLPESEVRAWQQSDGRLTGVVTDQGVIHGGHFIVAAGAWTDSVLSSLGWGGRIEPVRGQVVLLNTQRPLLRQVVESGARYLVPRDDGRVLIGSTEERVGFVKENTAEGVESLKAFAARWVPVLRDAAVERTWAGLRPGSRRGRPWIGPHPAYENLFVAAGHFRAGLANSVGTARLVRATLHGEPPEIPFSPYRIDPP